VAEGGWRLATFYAGDDLGTFNWWMRLITGLLFSLGAVWSIIRSLARSGILGERLMAVTRTPAE
jgi:hypothetical protein